MSGPFVGAALGPARRPWKGSRIAGHEPQFARHLPLTSKAAFKNIWSRGPDLNRGPADYESAALPTELPRRLFDCNIRGKKLSNFGRSSCAALARTANAPRASRRMRRREILQREMGYISHATPTPTSTNSANDHTAYLTPSELERCVRQASTSETSSANNSMAPKWLSRSALLISMDALQFTQLLLPVAISITSNTASTFTTPAAAMKRVP
jgi:hypothetical protein